MSAVHTHTHTHTHCENLPKSDGIQRWSIAPPKFQKFGWLVRKFDLGEIAVLEFEYVVYVKGVHCTQTGSF